MYRSHVLVCGGTGCTSSHSKEIIAALKLEATGLPVIYLCPVKSAPTVISGTIDIRKISKMADKLLAAVQTV